MRKAPPVQGLSVPEGCHLTVYKDCPVMPAVARADGGCLLVSMGMLTQQRAADMDQLLADLGEELRSNGPPGAKVLIGGKQLSDAFLKSTATAAMRAVVWIIDPRAFVLPQGEQLLLRLMDRWVDLELTSHVSSFIYLKPADVTVFTAVSSALARFGFRYWRTEEDGAFLYCAKRADGEMVSVPAGGQIQTQVDKSDWFQASVESKRAALRKGDAAEAAAIDAKQRVFLGQLLTNDPSLRPALDYAVELRQLIFRAHAGEPGAYHELLTAILEFDASFAFIAPPNATASGSMQTAIYDGRKGVELLPDMVAIQVAMDEFKLPEKFRRVSLLPRPREHFFASLADSELGISLWANDAKNHSKSPGVAVFIPAHDVRSLARGQLPASDAALGL